MVAATIERAAINHNFQRGMATVLRLERPQHQGRQLLRAKAFLAGQEQAIRPHGAVEGGGGRLGVGGELLARGDADQDRAVIATPPPRASADVPAHSE
jgi:hypothetical protein